MKEQGFYFNEKALIDFGNYLLSKYNVKVYSDDGKNIPLYERQITDADIRNWKFDYLDLRD